MTELKCSFGR